MGKRGGHVLASSPAVIQLINIKPQPKKRGGKGGVGRLKKRVWRVFTHNCGDGQNQRKGLDIHPREQKPSPRADVA